MRKKIVEAKNLSKKYGNYVAVDGLSFSVLEGECFGLLGPNGAGKTTVVRTVHCFFPITAGELRVMGLDVKTDKKRIKADLGVVPQEENFDPDLTVLENLTVYARYFDIKKQTARKRADSLLKYLQLEEKRANRIDELSAGMKRRLLIVRALINEPKLLILDEPTIGLDPQVRHLIWEKLSQLKKQGVTQILTTHYMEEAAELCDRIAIMDKGKILKIDKPRSLIREEVGKEVVEIRLNGKSETEALKHLEKYRFTWEKSGSTLYIHCDDGQAILGSLLKSGFAHILRRPASLEDVFLKLTGRVITK